MSCNHGNIVYSLESFLILKKNHFASILPIRFPMIFQGFLFECPEVFDWSGYIAENHSDLTHSICPWSTWQGKAQRNLLFQRNLLLKAIKLEKFELSSLKGAFVLVHCTIPLFQKQIQIIKKKWFYKHINKRRAKEKFHPFWTEWGMLSPRMRKSLKDWAISLQFYTLLPFLPER